MLPSSRTTSLSTRLRANNRLMAHVSANVSTLRCKRRTPLNNTGNLLVEKPAYLSTKFHILIHRDTNYLMLLLPLQIHAPSLTNDIGKNSTSLFSGEKRTGHAHTRCNNGALDSSANTALERSRHATRSAILPPFRPFSYPFQGDVEEEDVRGSFRVPRVKRLVVARPNARGSNALGSSLPPQAACGKD